MFCSFLTKVVTISLMMAIPASCDWFKNHPQEVEAVEEDLGDIAEKIIQGAKKSESRAPSPFAP